MNAQDRFAAVFPGGAPALGAWSSIGDAQLAEVLVAAGFDYVCLDQQHGLIDYASLVNMTRAIEARSGIALTRVPSNDEAAIAKALDSGVRGVVVPMVETGTQARAAVAACRYPPDGRRSFGPTRARLSLGSSRPRDLEQVLCLVQVETRDGLDALADIAAAPGLDGIYIGPTDLAMSLGIDAGDPDLHQRISPAVDTIQAACRDSGIAVGMHCLGAELTRHYIDRGFDIVTTIVDANFILRAAGDELRAARGSVTA